MSGIREREAVSCSPLELLDGLDVPVVLAGLDGTIRDANAAAAALYGTEELAGQPLAAGRLAGTELGAWIIDCALERGSWRGQIELSGTSLELRATRLGETVAIAFLETPRTAPEANLRATIDSLSAHVAVINEHGRVVAVNAAWRDFALSNGAPSEFLGVNYLDVCDAADDDRAALAGQQLRELLDGERESIELEYPCGDRWFVIRGMPYASDGRRWAIVIHLDITDRHHVREKLSLQAALLDELDVAVMATDIDHRVISWNAGAERLYGWTAQDTIGRRVDELMLTPGSYVDPAIGARLAGGRWDGECTSQRKDGSTFPAYFRVSVVRDDQGLDSAVVWVAMDISDRRRSDHHLKLARDYLRAVIDGMGQGMCTLDAQGHVSYMNQAAQDLLGWSTDELRGRDLHDGRPPARRRLAVPARRVPDPAHAPRRAAGARR